MVITLDDQLPGFTLSHLYRSSLAMWKGIIRHYEVISLIQGSEKTLGTQGILGPEPVTLPMEPELGLWFCRPEDGLVSVACCIL